MCSIVLSQERDVPVEQAEDQELEEEAEWIFKHAFLEQTITQQDVDEQGIHSIDTKEIKPHSTIGKIQEALNLMRNQLFEVCQNDSIFILITF